MTWEPKFVHLLTLLPTVFSFSGSMCWILRTLGSYSPMFSPAEKRKCFVSSSSCTFSGFTHSRHRNRTQRLGCPDDTLGSQIPLLVSDMTVYLNQRDREWKGMVRKKERRTWCCVFQTNILHTHLILLRKSPATNLTFQLHPKEHPWGAQENGHLTLVSELKSLHK